MIVPSSIAHLPPCLHHLPPMKDPLFLHLPPHNLYLLFSLSCTRHSSPFLLLRSSETSLHLVDGKTIPGAAYRGFSVSLSFKASSPSQQTSCTKHEKVYNARDLSLGLIDVCGWNVVAKGKGDVGKVAEIIQIGRLGSRLDADNEETTYEYVMKVVQASTKCQDKILRMKGLRSLGYAKNIEDNRLVEREFLLPIVDEFIQGVDADRRCLLILPPQGLLELANRPEAIRRLQPALLEFCRQHAGMLMERFTCRTKRNKTIKLNDISDGNIQEIVCAYMPTRKQLLAAGRWDLVKQINAAGGFLFVAQALNLKSTRRPTGFWDDLGRLDAEIEQFIQESWTKKVHEETGFVYYENQVTKDFSLQKVPTLAGQGGVKVMPHQKIICQAGRWDLHHAIVLNGGYREVARELDRQTIWTTARLSHQRLSAFNSMIRDCSE